MAKKNIIATDQDTQELKKKVKTENKGDVEQPKIYQTDMMVNNGGGKRLATISEEAVLRTQNLNVDTITSHKGDGHTFEISNMSVESAMEDLDRACNYRTGGQYSDDIKALLNDKYLLHALVDGQDVQMVISKEDHDRFLKANEENRLEIVRQILDIDPGHIKRGQDVENLVVQVKSTDGKLSTSHHVFDDEGLRRFENELGHKLIPPKPQIIEDAKTSIQKQENDYKLTIILDGKVYNATMTQQQHDKMMALDDRQKVNFLQKLLSEANIKGQSPDTQQAILQTLNNSLYNIQPKAEVYASATQSQGNQRTAPNAQERLSENQSLNSSLHTNLSEMTAACFEQLDRDSQEIAQSEHRGLSM